MRTELVSYNPFYDGIVMGYLDDHENRCFIQCIFLGDTWIVRHWEFTEYFSTYTED